jgi:hypothetical protein
MRYIWTACSLSVCQPRGRILSSPLSQRGIHLKGAYMYTSQRSIHVYIEYIYIYIYIYISRGRIRSWPASQRGRCLVSPRGRTQGQARGRIRAWPASSQSRVYLCLCVCIHISKFIYIHKYSIVMSISIYIYIYIYINRHRILYINRHRILRHRYPITQIPYHTYT